MKKVFMVLLILSMMTAPEGKAQSGSGFRLGEATQIVIGTSHLENSVMFYEKLGFNLIARDEVPNPWAQVSDGSLLVLLNQDGQEYIGLSYFSANMERKLPELEKMGIALYHRTEREGKFFQGIFITPEGLPVSLVNFDHSQVYQPDGIKFADLKPEDYSKPEKHPNPKIGIFGELAIPVTDLKRSLTYWKQLGFSPALEMQQPYPWAVVTDGKNVIGLHQTKEFNTKSITYFAPDMGKRIAHLKELGIDGFSVFKGSGGNESNQVLRTPEGQYIFLFSY